MNDYVPPPERKKLYANIIGYFPEQNSILIDRGANDGIRQYMPVIASKGLVGIIEVAEPGRSRVLLVTSRSIRVSAEVVGEQGPLGIVHGETPKRLILEVLETTDVKAGDEVVTSGFSEYIPKGIPLGTVIEAIDDPQFGTMRVAILPHVQMSELNEVFVLK
jgi:rod shape-determining protein MreC